MLRGLPCVQSTIALYHFVKGVVCLSNVLCALAHFSGRVRIFRQFINGIGKRWWVIRGHQQSIVVVMHKVGIAADAGGNHWQGASHGFQH